MICLTPVSQAQLKALLDLIVENKPVHVTRGSAPPQSTRIIEAFVDASRWGWGAVILPGGDNANGVQHFRQPWSLEEQAALPLWSSVCSEPRAMRMLLCRLATPNTHIKIHTDHAPLVWACAGRRWSGQPDYNAVHALLRDLEGRGITVELVYVEGSKNPADPLSRGVAPILEVTGIGETKKRKREGWEWHGREDVVPSPVTALTQSQYPACV
jgi:hypothetical protein